MPSEVFEEPIGLEVSLFEAVDPTAGSYPYPSLHDTGRTEKRTFRSVVLRNPYLQATFLPALGGRLISLLDRRTGLEILDRNLDPVADSARGAHIDVGLELHLDGRPRITSLGPVRFAAEEPEDDDDSASIWFAESVTGDGCGWHLKASMPPDRAELCLEARVFNRSFRFLRYDAGFRLSGVSAARRVGGSVVSYTDRGGIAFDANDRPWSFSLSDHVLTASRFDRERWLAPHQLDTFSVRLSPFSGLNGIGAVSREALMYVGRDQIQIQASTTIPSLKLVLLTAGGQTLEAHASLHPEQVFEVPLQESAAAIVLMDPSRRILAEWRAEDASEDLGSNPPRLGVPEVAVDLEDSFAIESRHIAHYLVGERALRDCDYSRADAEFEQSLLYNGEDHLAWWLKSVARRLGNEAFEESPELLNAHYLAPLEPALRAESFLAGPRSLSKDPSPLLQPLDDYPEEFIEVAALLMRAGLYEQSSRWIDEALRHVDLPMLRYLLAYSHLKISGLELEMAAEVAAAGRAPLGPPYPWRDVEVEAIEALAKRFSDDARLQALVQIMDRRS